MTLYVNITWFNTYTRLFNLCLFTGQTSNVFEHLNPHISLSIHFIFVAQFKMFSKIKSAFLTVFLALVQQAITTCDKEDSCKVCVKKGCIFILTANGEECVSTVVGRKIKVTLNR